MPLLFGLVGAGVLAWLGAWQLQRLDWKRAVLSDISARIQADLVDLPADVSPGRDQYLPVTVVGAFVGQEVHVLASRKRYGAGYRVISVFVVGERRVLVDRGFMAIDAKNTPRPGKAAQLTGNLHWPDETDAYTPAPDLAANIWFARDVDRLAGALGTERVLIVARSDTGDNIRPFPVSTTAIPNDHLGYAITWFLLALVWLGMTGKLAWRINRRI
jgi:surfeit locus 1 family protein